jgi:hypothetical protein
MAVHLRGAGPTDDPGGTQVLDLQTVSFGLSAPLCARPCWTGRGPCGRVGGGAHVKGECESNY